MPPLRRLLLLLVGLLLVGTAGWSRVHHPEQVTILMPAPFVDATAEQVKRFNAEHQGRIHLTVTPGAEGHRIHLRSGDQQPAVGRPPF